MSIMMMVLVCGIVLMGAFLLPQRTYAASRDMNVNAWLASCKAITNRIADNDGYYWSKGCPTAYYEKKFYKKTLGSKKVYLNCADYACWCLQKYGVLPAGKRYYVQGYTVRTFPGKKSNYMKKLKKLQTIYIAKKGVPASTLVKRTGTKSLKKGDLISAVKKNGKGHHIMIYAGKVDGKMVRKMIKTLQKQGWQFIFMGANMDAVTEAERLGISKKHAVSYRNDSKGVALNYAVTGGILSKMRDSSLSVEDIDRELDDAFEPIRRHLEK